MISKPDQATVERIGIQGIVAVQIVCACFFVWEILASAVGIPATPIPWRTYELIEIFATLGPVTGSVVSALTLRRTFKAKNAAEDRLRTVSVAFSALLEERFTAWGLTPAERDVAMFAIKGLSTADIATMRSTSEGTVKAQTAAIYRKAGVAGRAQLLSLFIEDMMDDGDLAVQRQLAACA